MLGCPEAPNSELAHGRQLLRIQLDRTGANVALEHLNAIEGMRPPMSDVANLGVVAVRFNPGTVNQARGQCEAGNLVHVAEESCVVCGGIAGRCSAF